MNAARGNGQGRPEADAPDGAVRPHPGLGAGARLALFAAVAPDDGAWEVRCVAARPIPRTSADEVRVWFGRDFLAPLVPDPSALARAAEAEGVRNEACDDLDDDDKHEHEQRMRLLLASAPPVICASFVWREPEGGRRYCFFDPDVAGTHVMAEKEYKALRRTQKLFLLQAIPRSLRFAFPAPPGHVYIVADIERCFPVLLATVAGDEALLSAAYADVHRLAGDAMAPALPAQMRREIGKRFNNAVVGGITPHGWLAHLREFRPMATFDDAERMHSVWWGFFPRAKEFRDQWSALQARAVDENRSLRLLLPDGRPHTFDRAKVRGSAPLPKWAHLTDPRMRFEASVRTTFSALWRGIEGVILDRAIQLLFPLRERGLRLVLTMYDGLLLQAPENAAVDLTQAVKAAFRRALDEVGVPAGVSVDVRQTWGE